MKLFIYTLAVVSLFLFACQSDAGKNNETEKTFDIATQKDKIIGIWKFKSGKSNNEPLPEGIFNDYKIEFIKPNIMVTKRSGDENRLHFEADKNTISYELNNEKQTMKIQQVTDSVLVVAIDDYSGHTELTFDRLY